MEQLFYIPSTMIWPLAACLVLTGIHVYLGVHVIARKVIFVDLALAQIAALGTVIGVLLAYEVGKDTTALYLYSLAFTIFGAFVFAVTRMRGEKVPHEAIIGIVYAVTFAATILVLSRSALGPQELDQIIKGELLWVQAEVVIKTAAIYAAVGLFHFIFRKKFMAISFAPETAEREGINVRLWDFLFYMSFGFVITSSVAIAGVFLVFSYLVIPAVGAMLLSEKLGTRLAIGWIAGSIISFIGVKLSWDTGLPTSPLIVCVLAVALILSGVFRYVKRAPVKQVALRNLVASAGVAALFVAGVLLLRKPHEDPFEHALHLLTSPLSTDRQLALTTLRAFPEGKSEWLPLVLERLRDEDAGVRKAAIELIRKSHEHSVVSHILPLLRDRSDDVRRSAIDAVRDLGDSEKSEELIIVARVEEDEEIKIELLEAALELGNIEAIPLLIDLAARGGIFAEDAYRQLKNHVEVPEGISGIAQLNQWWRKHGKDLKWDQSKNLFVVKP